VHNFLKFVFVINCITAATICGFTERLLILPLAVSDFLEWFSKVFRYKRIEKGLMQEFVYASMCDVICITTVTGVVLNKARLFKIKYSWIGQHMAKVPTTMHTMRVTVFFTALTLVGNTPSERCPSPQMHKHTYV